MSENYCLPPIKTCVDCFVPMHSATKTCPVCGAIARKRDRETYQHPDPNK